MPLVAFIDQSRPSFVSESSVSDRESPSTGPVGPTGELARADSSLLRPMRLRVSGFPQQPRPLRSIWQNSVKYGIDRGQIKTVEDKAEFVPCVVKVPNRLSLGNRLGP